MPDCVNATPSPEDGSSPRLFDSEIAAKSLIAAASRVEADRLDQAIRDLPEIVAGGPIAATGDDVIDDLEDFDPEAWEYLILDQMSGGDADDN